MAGSSSWEIVEVDGAFVVTRADARFEVCPCCGQKMTLQAARAVVLWLEEGPKPELEELARKLQVLGRVTVERRGRKSWSGI
jgi:hypothetical protein